MTTLRTVRSEYEATKRGPMSITSRTTLNPTWPELASKAWFSAYDFSFLRVITGVACLQLEHSPLTKNSSGWWHQLTQTQPHVSFYFSFSLSLFSQAPLHHTLPSPAAALYHDHHVVSTISISFGRLSVLSRFHFCAAFRFRIIIF